MRNAVRYSWIFVGTILTLLIGSLFLPIPLRDELVWNQPSLFFLHNTWLSWLFSILLLAIFVWPFINSPVLVPYVRWKWKPLEKKRQQAVDNRLSGKVAVTFPLPEIFPPFPTTLSLRICRNWRSTLIASTIYTVLIEFVLLAFVADWQTTMHYLEQRGEISGWTLLGSIFDALFYCMLIFPPLIAFIFAPRQRLIATQNGLICYYGLRFSYIPWHEALLFAVITEQNNTLVYELASSTSLIRWSSKPTWTYADTFPSAIIGIAPLGLVRAENSTEEYQWQIRQLTAMVAFGTGLPLYDLRQQTANSSQ